MARKRLLLTLLVLACACVFATRAVRSAQDGLKQNASKKTSPAASTPQPSPGERRFRQNCGRCHHPPEDISPREARAVVRQMRVRAMLSAEDEKLILEYLAP